MPTFRRRYTLGSFMVMVILLAVCLALTRGLPWWFPVALSIVIPLVFLIPGFTVAERLTLIAIACILLGLALPPIQSQCGRVRPGGTPRTTPIPVGIPISGVVPTG